MSLRIGFYPPLKALDHPVPSGDRQMARLLASALRAGGHLVEVISSFRSFLPTPEPAALAALEAAADIEVAAIAKAWTDDPGRRPDLLFCYHVYYKAPDMIGLRLAEQFGLPYVTAEASHAPKRAHGPWSWGHAWVERAIRRAAVNFCYTENDRAGLADLVEDHTSLVSLPPFIDTSGFQPRRAKRHGSPVRLVTVAMMRPGDKLQSYRLLADALQRLPDLDWHLSLIGDGPARAAVGDAFHALPADRIDWLGQLDGEQIASLLPDCDLFTWPGFNEAFGISYLEAQACGLPAVAIRGEGTPSVIEHERTGLLTAGEAAAYAESMRSMIVDAAKRKRFGEAAATFVHGERDLAGAASRLNVGLARALSGRTREPSPS